MAIKRLGAQRFSGLDADVPSLPIDADLVGAIFSSTDTLKFWIFNGTTWNESAGGGGITGLNPNSTILDHSTTLADYTSPVSATATSGTPANAIDENTSTFWISDAGINESITIDMGSVLNDFALAYYISTAELASMTETQFQIFSPVIISGEGDAVWGLLGDQTIENFTTYADQSEIDSLWVPTDIAKLRGNPITDVYDFFTDSTNQDSLISYDIGTANISETAWVFRMKLDLTSLTVSGGGNGYTNTLGLGDALTQGESPAIDLLGLRIHYSGSVQRFDIVSINGGSTTTTTFSTTPLEQEYYIEMIRESATVFRISLFSDDGFSTLIESDTVATSTGVSSLRYFRHQLFTSNDTAGNIDGTGDDIQLWNNLTVAPPLVFGVGTLLRTIKTVDLIPDEYNFIRFNGVNTQLLTIEGSSGSSLVMAANDLQVLLETDPPLVTAHGQFEINGTNDTLALNGGDPVSSVIEDPQVNSLTLNNVGTQNDPIAGASVMWQQTQDANNDTTRIKMKINGSIEEVRFF